MKTISEYKDWNEFFQDAEAEGQNKTAEGRQRVFAVWNQELMVRKTADRLRVAIAAVKQTARSTIYNKLRLADVGITVFDEALLRLHLDGVIESVQMAIPKEGRKRSRRSTIYVWISEPKKVEMSDERYQELIEKALSRGDDIIEPLSGSDARITATIIGATLDPVELPASMSQLADIDPLDAAIEARKRKS